MIYMLNENIVIALIASSFPTIGIAISAYFQYKSTRKADGKLDEIHDLTNATATQANEQISKLHQEITRLEKVISSDE